MSAIFGYPAVRELLTAARTYYVRADGSDSNTGLADSSGGAFLTIQKAIDVAASLDMSIYQVTIQVGAGTYTAALTLKPCLGALPPILKGDTGTPGNVIISTTSATAVTVPDFANWRLQGFKVTVATSGNGVLANGLGRLLIDSAMEYGAIVGQQIACGRGGYLQITAAYTISGAAAGHLSLGTGGIAVLEGGFTVTVSGTPAITTFAGAAGGAFLRATGITFSGSATGARYSVTGNAVVETGGGGANFFPGNSAGSTATGGQYS